MWDSTLQEKFNFCFLRVFLLILTKFSFWQKDWTLAYNYMRFRHFPEISWFSKILNLRSFGNSWGNPWYIHIYKNCTSFHLWWKENLVKNQKVSKYYENGCSYHLGSNTWMPDWWIILSKPKGLWIVLWEDGETSAILDEYLVQQQDNKVDHSISSKKK